MFLKLFKHDFIDLKNSFFTLFLIVGIVSFTVPFFYELLVEGILANLTGDPQGYGSVVLLMLGWLLMNFFYIVEILFIVVTLRNFARCFYGQEGYFTLTLPISTGKNVLSKILAMIVWGLMFILIALIGLTVSICIVISVSKYLDFNSVIEVLKSIKITDFSPNETWSLIYTITEGLISQILSLAVILFAMTLAHIKPFNKHSVLFTILFLLGFTIAAIVYFAISFSSTDASVTLIMQIVTLSLTIAFIPLFILGTIKLIDKKVEIQ